MSEVEDRSSWTMTDDFNVNSCKLARQTARWPDYVQKWTSRSIMSEHAERV